jgi:hypothetical protein
VKEGTVPPRAASESCSVMGSCGGCLVSDSSHLCHCAASSMCLALGVVRLGTALGGGGILGRWKKGASGEARYGGGGWGRGVRTEC